MSFLIQGSGKGDKIGIYFLTFIIILFSLFIGQLFSQKVADNKLKMVFGLFVILIGLLILLIEFT